MEFKKILKFSKFFLMLLITTFSLMLKASKFSLMLLMLRITEILKTEITDCSIIYIFKAVCHSIS